jgi:hypothetical protein
VIHLVKTIIWLRGDPESFKVISRLKELLEVQGIRIVIPNDLSSRMEADVVVMPKPGSPEEKAIKRDNLKTRYLIKGVEDPWLALSLAIASPLRRFNVLSIGIDPGPKVSGLSAIADSVLLWTSKITLDEVVPMILWLESWIPSIRRKVYIGRSQFSKELATALAEKGIPYILVDEEGTTKAPSRWYVLERLKDRETVASATIALLGMLSS